MALLNRWQTSKNSEKERTFTSCQDWEIDFLDTLQRSLLFTPEVIIRFWDNLDWCANLKLVGGTHNYKSQTTYCSKRFSNGCISQVLTSDLVRQVDLTSDQWQVDLCEFLKVSLLLLGAWLSLEELQEDNDTYFLKTDWCCVSSALLSSLHRVY